MELKDIIALILGTIGTTLGILNAVRSFLDNRVRLRVIPILSYDIGKGVLSARQGDQLLKLFNSYGAPTASIEVVNLSKFPITIDEVGFCEVDLNRNRARAPFFQPRTVNGTSLPSRLEPREAITLLSTDGHATSYKFTSKTRAYAHA